MGDPRHVLGRAAEEAAAKLLDEMKELVTDAVQKLQGPPRTSPFAREARLSHS